MHARLLVGGQREPFFQLEHVHRARIPVLVGRKRHAEAAAVAYDGVELLEAGHGSQMTIGDFTSRVLVSGVLRIRAEGNERQCAREHQRTAHRTPPAGLQVDLDRYLCSATASRWPSTTATCSCSRYCASTLPPNCGFFSAKNRATSASSAGVARPVTPSA